MTETLASPVRGVIPPMVTPLSDRDELDEPGLERLIEHILAGGVHGLFILGTTGEGPSLSYRLRRELVERTCRQVAGRVPVLVCISDTAFTESVRKARHAADAGAAAVVFSSPYYFPAGQPELFEYVEDILPELPLPVFLYNMPSLTKVVFEPETVGRLLGHEKIHGLKDSSANMIYFNQILRLAERRPDWSLLVGPEELLPEAVLMGGHGCVGGGANLFPRVLVDLYEAAAGRDFERIAALHKRLMQLNRIYFFGRHGSSMIKGLKCALNLTGICSDFMAEPFRRFRAPEREKVKQCLEELDLLS